MYESIILIIIHSIVNGIYTQVQPWCITDVPHMCTLSVYHNHTSVIHLSISNFLHGVSSRNVAHLVSSSEIQGVVALLI